MILELNERVAEYMYESPMLRYGQCVFLAMEELTPELAEEVRGTDLDPFPMDRGDNRLEAFWDWYLDKTGDFKDD